MRLTFLLFCSLLLVMPASAQRVVPDEPPLLLDPHLVLTGGMDDPFDSTGMGSLEEQMRDEPFSNDLIRTSDFTLEDSGGLDLAGELSAVATPSPSDRIAGDDRLRLRGFPTPVLRNGFIQLGVNETLSAARTLVIQGPLVPVLGRAAPGGIQDAQTARPRNKPQHRFETQFTSLDRQRAQVESTGPVIAKKAWQRVAVDWQRREGPEEFANEESLLVSAALTWKHSRTASTLVSANFREINAHASPGIPDYRPVGGGLIAGPYLPLANFNANGPDAAVRRRSGTIGVQFDGQAHKRLAFRANAEAWWRVVEQDRYTSSVLSLDSGLFEGTREPRHIEQPQRAFVVQLEATGRFRALGAEHKMMAAMNHTWGNYGREVRALPTAVRDALPLSVRRFNPFAPDYFYQPFDPDVFSRVLTDRREDARYAAVELSDRMAFARGRWVASAGMRYDVVHLSVDDLRPSAPRPHLRGTTEQLSYHAGLNWQARPSKLLVYASTSTAFDPSTRVDVRTGRIQANETTLGYEAGVKGRAWDGRIDYGVGGFLLFNQNISRVNPLYDDPVADANQTQPQLVSAGEERFRGGRVDVRAQLSKPLTLQLRAVYLEAITTSSPDLPQEVGRELPRTPAFTANAQLRYRTPGQTNGLLGAVGWQFLDRYVVNYADARRDYLAFPGYGLVNVSAGYAWRSSKRTIELEVGVRNVFDRDILASNARLGAGREFTFSTRWIF